MNIHGQHYRTIWEKDSATICVIDQRKLPFVFEIEEITSPAQIAAAIKDMHIRGAGLIGATAGYGMYLAAKQLAQGSAGNFTEELAQAAQTLKATRPTAVNLAWAVDRQLAQIAQGQSLPQKVEIALDTARKIADEDVQMCRDLGHHGLEIIRSLHAQSPTRPVNILTHCNAGWLAFVDYGSATAPIYAAHDAGIPVHVWVDETRPRNQGASLTAWELGEHGVSHTLIVDNAGGHLMQHGQVDLVITGADRVTRAGDAANKIGTYLKALAAHDNGIPFYVALPSSTFDWDIRDGIKEIPIEERDSHEVTFIEGRSDHGQISRVQIAPENTPVSNFGFDVTPARLITGLITERGICPANENDICKLFEKSMTPPTT